MTGSKDKYIERYMRRLVTAQSDPNVQVAPMYKVSCLLVPSSILVVVHVVQHYFAI